jgi:hypothetical protein
MSPEKIAELEKSDPKKLGDLRAAATLAQINRDSAGATAARLEQEVLDSQAQHGGGVLGKLAELFGGGAPAGSGKGGKVDVGNEVRVRVVNPNDLKPTAANSPSGGAPTAPGYTRGG